MFMTPTSLPVKERSTKSYGTPLALCDKSICACATTLKPVEIAVVVRSAQERFLKSLQLAAILEISVSVILLDSSIFSCGG